MAGWATQWTSVQPREHARRWHRRLCRALFGTGSDGFHARATRLEPREAATITTAGVTAWRALVGDGQIKTGDTVLVLGTGGVSIRRAADREDDGAAVIATSSSDEKLERVRTLGADHVINYRKSRTGGSGCETSQDAA